jgi:hypothetical protein
MSIENKVLVRIHEFDCSLEDITSKLHLKPTNGWLKGELIPNRKQAVYRKQSTWELKASVSPDSPVEIHIEFLLNAIEPVKEMFKALVSKYEGELSIVSHIREDYNPGMHFSSALVKRISELGLEMDFDLYFYPSDELAGTHDWRKCSDLCARKCVTCALNQCSLPDCFFNPKRLPM